MKPAQRAQGGFAAIAAIFLVVALAALGGFMVSFSNTQQITAAQDVQGIRAYWAARAGLEWGLSKASASSGACPTGAPASVNGFTLTIACVRTVYTDGATSVVVFRFDSKASLGTSGTPNFIERSVSASVEM